MPRGKKPRGAESFQQPIQVQLQSVSWKQAIVVIQQLSLPVVPPAGSWPSPKARRVSFASTNRRIVVFFIGKLLLARPRDCGPS